MMTSRFDAKVLATLVMMVIAPCQSRAASRPVRAEVVKCTEASSCVFRIFLGFGATMEQPVKFCNVEPLQQHRDDRARARRARAWTERHLLDAKSITLHIQMSPGCAGNSCELRLFDRLLAWVVADMELVNDRLLAGGLVVSGIMTCKR